MLLKSLLILSASLFSAPLFASSLRDSIGVENNNGKKVIIHKVETKETYYSLGRKYKVSPKIILEFNYSKPLHPGNVIKIPTDRLFDEVAQPAQAKATPAADEPIDYKVGPKETLYAIAKRFNTTVEELQQLNDLKGNALSIGQVIKVRPGTPVAAVAETVQAPPKTAPVPAVEKDHVIITPADTSSLDADSKLKQNRYGLRQHDEHGVGVWIAEEDMDSSKMLALHNTLPSGTIVKVTNPMNGKSTFVKVIGRYTENETTKEVIIVITKAVADLIGVIDKRFQVNITY